MEQTEIEIINDYLKSTGLSNRDLLIRRYNDAITSCFKAKYTESKRPIEGRIGYLMQGREIIDLYLKDDYQLLKQKIIGMRTICYSRKEIENTINTLDFQILFLESCETHEDVLKKNFEFQMSDKTEIRREFNIEIYHDILDYLIENT